MKLFFYILFTVIFTMIFAPLFIIGCSNKTTTSVSYCKQEGYKGIVNYKNDYDFYCSNGEVHGENMLTSNGEMPLELIGKNGNIPLIYTEFK